MKVRIEIDTKTFVRFWLVVIGFAFLILAIISARNALIVLGISFFLALALNAPVTALARHLPGRSRVGATAISYVVVIFILGSLLFLLIPTIVQQTAKFIETIPSVIHSFTANTASINHLIHQYHLENQVNNTLISVKNSAGSFASRIGNNLVTGLGSLIGVLTSLLLVLVLTFLMLVEGPEWLNRLWGIYNDEDRMEYHRDLAHRMYAVVTGYVTGQLTVSAICAVFSALLVFVLSLFFHQIPANLALPTLAIAFLFSLIPMFGATIAGLIVAILIAFNIPIAGLIFIVAFFIYQQVENNFISPSIQSKRLELSALAVLVAVTIGVYLFGIAGGIISIPIAGCIKVLLESYLQRAKRNRDKSDKPFHRILKKLEDD